MLGIGETPTEDEVREAFIAARAWAYEPKSHEEAALGKTAEELAVEAFDSFILDRIHKTLAPLQTGLRIVVDKSFSLHHNVS